MATNLQNRDDTRPTRVLLVWEQGGALGHQAGLGALAQRLVARNCEVHALLQRVSDAEDWYPREVTIERGVPTPMTPTGMADATYADVLARFGWRSPKVLGPAVTAWRERVEALDPDVVVLDSAPTVHLALRGTGRRVVGFGSPWFAPPPVDQMPQLAWWRPPVPGSSEREARVLETANAVRTTGTPKLSRLTDVWDETRWVLLGPPAFDPWLEHRREDTVHAGPTAVLDRGGTRHWPAGEGPRVFAYLKASYPKIDAVLASLEKQGCRTLAYIAGNQGTHRSTQRTVVSHEPLALGRIRQSADLLVTHSALTTGSAFLAAGVPGLFLPMHLEQLASGRCGSMRLKGVATLPLGAVDAELDGAIRLMLHPSLRAAARAQAPSLATPIDPNDRVAEVVISRARTPGLGQWYPDERGGR